MSMNLYFLAQISCSAISSRDWLSFFLGGAIGSFIVLLIDKLWYGVVSYRNAARKVRQQIADVRGVIGRIGQTRSYSVSQAYIFDSLPTQSLDTLIFDLYQDVAKNEALIRITGDLQRSFIRYNNLIYHYSMAQNSQSMLDSAHRQVFMDIQACIKELHRLDQILGKADR